MSGNVLYRDLVVADKVCNATCVVIESVGFARIGALKRAVELGRAVVFFLECFRAVHFLDSVCRDINASLFDSALAVDVRDGGCRRAAYRAVVIVCDEVCRVLTVDEIVADKSVCALCAFVVSRVGNEHVFLCGFERIVIGGNFFTACGCAEVSFTVLVVVRKAGLAAYYIVYTIY